MPEIAGLDLAAIATADRVLVRPGARAGQVEVGRWVTLDSVGRITA